MRENIIFLELFGIGPYIAVILVLYVERNGVLLHHWKDCFSR
ncbi:MAG TPA: hypothetical protein PLL52_03550 [Caldisericia bacterium]|nr:hypothetical protein [Caldisericia bacterium]